MIKRCFRRQCCNFLCQAGFQVPTPTLARLCPRVAPFKLHMSSRQIYEKNQPAKIKIKTCQGSGESEAPQASGEASGNLGTGQAPPPPSPKYFQITDRFGNLKHCRSPDITNLIIYLGHWSLDSKVAVIDDRLITQQSRVKAI